MKRFSVPLILLIFAACAQAPVPSEAPSTKAATITTYYKASTEIIANPERGFYRHPGPCHKDKTSSVAGRTTPFNVEMLKSDKAGDKKMTLVLCIFYLPKDSDIGAALAFFEEQAKAVEAAGLKMILRFAYSEGRDDVPRARVMEHLVQIKPYLQKYSYVIAVVESGFVGAYGEGYSTQNFGDKGVVTEQNWLDRKAIVDELMTILPSRIVSVRTLKMKRKMYFPGTTEATAVSSSDAYGTKPAAQVGYYNDCFLNGITDSDTYRNPLKNGSNYSNIPMEDYPVSTKDYLMADKAYLALDTKYVVMGGETCDIKNGDQWKGSNAVGEMQKFHFSYLNGVRKMEILNSWESSGHIPIVKRSLGYRFELYSTTFPPSVVSGEAFQAQFSIKNIGWAALINSRPVYLVMRNTATGVEYKRKLAIDARNWQPSSTPRPVTANVSTSDSLIIKRGIPAGTYSLHLWLPDPAPSLTNKPEYAIRLVSIHKPSLLQRYDIWQSSTGYNNLFRSIVVKSPPPPVSK